MARSWIVLLVVQWLLLGAAQASTFELQRLSMRTVSQLLVIQGEGASNLNLNAFSQHRAALASAWEARRLEASAPERDAMQRFSASLVEAIDQIERDKLLDWELPIRIDQQMRQLLSRWHDPADLHAAALLGLEDLNYRYLHLSYAGLPEIRMEQAGYFSATHAELITTLNHQLERYDGPDAVQAHTRWTMLKRLYAALDLKLVQTVTAPLIATRNMLELAVEMERLQALTVAGRV